MFQEQDHSPKLLNCPSDCSIDENFDSITEETDEFFAVVYLCLGMRLDSSNK